MIEPAWLTHAIDQRMALLAEHLGSTVSPELMIMTPLTEPAPGTDFDRWDRTCDGCGTYCGAGKSFYTGHLVRQLQTGTPVTLTFGVCAGCRVEMGE